MFKSLADTVSIKRAYLKAVVVVAKTQ